MTTITTNQALRRWDLLSERMREALFSEHNSKLVRDLCAAEHVTAKEKTDFVMKIASLVLMGFVNQKDVPKELHDGIGLPLQVGQAIADALALRLFSPFKDEIEKLYALPKEGVEKTQPAVVEEEIKEPEVRIEEGVATTAPPVTVATEWGNVAPPPVVTKPLEAPLPPRPRENGKKEREKKTPFFIYKEAEFRPIPKPPSIRKGYLEQKFTDVKISPEIARPPLPVRLEIGPSEPPKPPYQNKSGTKQTTPVARTPVAPQRVVHYSQWKTPLPSKEEKREKEEKATIPPPVPIRELGMRREEGKEGKEEETRASSFEFLAPGDGKPSTAPPIPTQVRPAEKITFPVPQTAPEAALMPASPPKPPPVVPEAAPTSPAPKVVNYVEEKMEEGAPPT